MVFHIKLRECRSFPHLCFCVMMMLLLLLVASVLPLRWFFASSASSSRSLFAVTVNICVTLVLLHPCVPALRPRSPPVSHHHLFPDPVFITRFLSCKISIFHSVCAPSLPRPCVYTLMFLVLSFFLKMCLFQVFLLLVLNFIWVLSS